MHLLMNGAAMNSPDAEPQSAWRERPDYRVDLLTADGRLMASFTQDAMIRGFDDSGARSAIPAEARLLPARARPAANGKPLRSE
jgi:hypothetical protein